MITLLISRGYVTGAETALMGWFLCTAVYFAGCMLFSFNRSRNGLRRIGTWFLVTELVVDLLWCLIWYGDQGYVNYGVGGAYVVVLWPGALLVAGIVATAMNQAEISD